MGDNFDIITRYWETPLGDRFLITADNDGIYTIEYNGPVPNQLTFSFEETEHDEFPASEEGQMHWELGIQLDEYFSGKLPAISIPINDNFTDLEDWVYERVKLVSYGRTMTYAQLAQCLGGSVTLNDLEHILAENRLPLINPCHRIVVSDIDCGNYVWGRKIKQRLLHWEAQNLPKLVGMYL